MSQMFSWSSLKKLDWIFLAAIAALLTVGVAFIHSASARSEELLLATNAGRQIGWVIVGTICFLMFVLFDYEKSGDAAWGIYFATIAMLILVLLVGKKVYGAYRWLSLFGFNIQPSEFAKLSIVILLARFLSESDRNIQSPKTIMQVLIITGIPCLFILKQPDLGTAMTLVPVAIVLMFAAGVPVRFLVLLGIVGLLAMVPAWFALKDFQRERLLVFLDASRDPLGAGWNKIQSEIAVGSGGLTGKGYLMGTQNILGFLPRTAAPTDFIYSVIAEEMGFIGSATLLSLFAVLLWGGMRAAHRARDKMGRLLAAGVVTLLFSHVFVNMAMTVGLMPITGIPLPLISYGGSFMVCMMAALGLVQSVYVRREMRG
jgi:rod shape determining protein RodA